MTKSFLYKEVVYSPKMEFIDQINNEGLNGWEFVTQAQKLIPGKIDFKTGQPHIQVMLIYKKEINKPLNEKEGKQT